MVTSLPGPLLDQFSTYLAERAGLYFPPERWTELERGIMPAAAELGFDDAATCIRSLLSSEWSQTQIEALAGHLTVGETYFFREPKTFEILEQQILPELLASRRKGYRFLRFWCAACCTGEEPYSLAILLDRMMPDIADWNITILATDINSRFLRHAGEGIYGDWSFRGGDPHIKASYFTPHPGNRFKIIPRIKNRVTFAYHNLVDGGYPSFSSNTNGMDIIFCRNVLMYFAKDCAKQVIDRLYRALVGGGWLIPSAVDGSPAQFAAFEPAPIPGIVLYRKPTFEPTTVPARTPEAAEPSTPLLPTLPRSIDRVPAGESAQSLIGAGNYGEAVNVLKAHLHDDPEDSEAMSVLAQTYANQGRLEEALEWCRRAIDVDRLAAGNHYLLAMIHQERGDLGEAVASLRRALFLDPDFILAHFALATLGDVLGHRAEARRHYRNTMRLLEGRPPDEVLLASDGITVGQIQEAVRHARVAGADE